MIILKKIGKKIYKKIKKLVSSSFNKKLNIDNEIRQNNINIHYDYNMTTDINFIKIRTIEYVEKLRLYDIQNKFIGYKHSYSTTRPVLYNTIAALLIKHLYGIYDKKEINNELNYVLNFQDDDGLFKDSVIKCEIAEKEDWWGWKHLTLHALMTLALYNKTAKKEISYINQFYNKDYFKKYLESKDWSEKAAWTSNELQNLGVMLQYSRDYHNNNKAVDLINILYEVIDEKQDKNTGLYGNKFDKPLELSLGVQAGYHFWLLYFYDNREIKYKEKIIDNILKTQNILGGYGVRWNSSACEDIDSIDPLYRFSKLTDYRKDDIQDSLKRALPAIIHNLNGDGGFVFRRHEELKIVHDEMYSKTNESNLFFTWFRTLSLAYCLKGLKEIPQGFEYNWNFKKAPGHQF